MHVLDNEARHGEEIVLSGLPAKVKKAVLMNGGKKIKFDAAKNSFMLPKAERDAIDTIVVLEMANKGNYVFRKPK